MSFQINPEISKASTFPKEFYLDPKYFNLSLENIFSDSWQMITDMNIFQSGNIYPFTFLPDSLNEPLLLIQNSNKIHCCSNVCTHRAHLVSTKHCHGTKLRCKYHGRTFNIDGSFNFMPGFDEVNNFPTDNDNLSSVPCKNWENLIFVSLTGLLDITPVLKDIKNRIPNYPFSKLVLDKNHSQEWEINAHWALYCENFLEGFHVPYVHQGLAKEINLSNYQTILIDNGVLQLATGKEKFDVFLNNSNPDETIYGLYYWIFPNIMLNFYSWGLSINIIEPLSINRTRIKFLSYPIKNNQQPESGDATLSQVELEDQEVVLNVQKGIRSRFYKYGRYSTKYEQGVHHFHLLLKNKLSI